ncbi:PEP-CTERM sorting domain-containing protein [Nostoc sp. CALU 1950]|uniref:PEP-CTERM sorting domain-containing protein n=1 Tax=Nostoc sp. CALU 1950 TaxID=3104321 RepID=UPI003EB93074
MQTLSILKKVSAVAAASVVAVIATGGKASAITFNLGGSTLVNPTYAPVSGVTLTASASATPNIIPGTTNIVLATNAVRTTGGLGIRTSTQTSSGGFILTSPDTTDQIDGLGAFETLTLAFNQAVKLTSVTFGNVGSGLLNDDFIFFRNGTQIGSSQDVPGGNFGDTATGIFTPSLAFQTGNSFGFRASQVNDDFFIRSVEVEAVPVPEPITIAAMVMGSGFGVILRRKYAKGAKPSSKLSS